MKFINTIFIYILLILFAPLVMAQSPEGNWNIPDEKTGKKRATAQLRISNGVLNGTIVQIFPIPGDTGVCQNCSGNFKNKPVVGLQFLWGLRENAKGVWEGGHVLDPKTGKIYKVNISIKDNKLHMRGFIGVTMLGRTQTWVR
jgi:uncharacterized protein (DUF2147 family)